MKKRMYVLPLALSIAHGAIAQTCDLSEINLPVRCGVTWQTTGPSGRPCLGAFAGHSINGGVLQLECAQTGAKFYIAAFSDPNPQGTPDGLCPLLMTGQADRHLLDIPASGTWQWTFVGPGMDFDDWNTAASPEEAADMILRKWFSPNFWTEYRAETYGIEWKPPYDESGWNQWYRTGQPGRFQVFFVRREDESLAGKTWADVRCGNRQGESDHGNSLHETHVDASAGPCADLEQPQSPTIDFSAVQYGTQDNGNDSRRAWYSPDGGFLSSGPAFMASIAGGAGESAMLRCEALGP